MSRTEDRDAVEFLTDQHQEIRRRFGAVAQGAGDSRQREFESLIRLLAVHETAEEEVIYPALRTFGDHNAVVEARQAEEDEAKKQLVDLERMDVGSPEFLTQLELVRTGIEAHASAEEREVFPALRAALEDDRLARMASALQVAEALAPTHPHKMAPESASGNLLVGPFVAIADRARDALRELRR